MEPAGRLVDKVHLDNELTVYFYDQSRETAGDRRQIKLLIHIPMAIKLKYFEQSADPENAYESFSAMAGKTVCLQIEKVRNFIDVREGEQTLLELKEEFLKANLSYISRPDFAAKFVLNRYRQWREQTALTKMRPC